MGQYLGRASVRVAGVLYETMDGAKLSNPMGLEREAVTGTEIFGYTEKVAVPMIDCAFPMNTDFGLDDLWAVTDDTITFEGDDGTIFTLSNAWTSKAADITAGQGAKFTVQFQAKACRKQ